MSPSRKRNRTEESLHEEQFEEFKSMSANETSVADKSGNLNCTDSHVQTNTEDSPPSSSTADQTEVAVEEESNASDDIESLLTQRTPEVPPDQVCMTPRDDTQTLALSSDPSTPGGMCIGKESRRNSVNLMMELEKAAEITEENGEENNIEISDGKDAATISDSSLDMDSQNSNDAVFLNSLYELHLYNQNNKHESGTAELEKKVCSQEKMIDTLVCEKKVLERQVEGYTKEMFEKEQKLKIMADRVKQLENSNNYRKEVARLEVEVEKREADLRTL